MSTSFFEEVDSLRVRANKVLEGRRRSELGQYLTPAPISRIMASMFDDMGPRDLRILDPGAGVGSLLAAYVERLLQKRKPPKRISVTAYEIDHYLATNLSHTLRLCRQACDQVGIDFTGKVIAADFMAAAVDTITGSLFNDNPVRFNRAILNPPYRKINSSSQARRLLRQVGVETTNLYTGFLALTMQLLEPGGEMVAITPRSFCNGSYFQSFRELFLKEMELRRLRVFESRKQAFRDDDILQENVILQAVKKGKKNPRNTVNIENSIGPNEPPRSRKIAYSEVIHPGDQHFFIHIAGDEKSDQAAEQIRSLNTTLPDLGLTVSTGRVVDFRAKKYLRTQPGDDTVPLIWPTHFDNGYIRWPKLGSKKPQAIRTDKRIEDQLVPNEPYVLVRRFSAKEERRRVFAAIYDPTRLKTPFIGFENHLNYFHQHGRGLDIPLARGLAAYLNSTAVDMYVRRFNGHTQVNATDLRTLRYPTIKQLRALGRRIPDAFPDQEQLDVMVLEELEFAT